MNAEERGNRIESATMARVGEIYAEAMQQAVRNQKVFLAKIKAIDEGRLKPPQWYVDRGMEDKWRQGFLRELLRREKVVDGFMKELNSAGSEAAQLIQESMVEIYRVNREEATQRLTGEASRMYNEDLSFALYDKRQIGVILQKNQSPMSKLAYKNMGQNPVIRRNLQNALAQSILLGESQRDLLKRIQRITGQTVSQARRVAQTERTRVQSQARVQAGEEARQKGVEVYHEWSCAFIPPHKTRHGFSSGSRESHMDLDGKTALAGEAFHTIWGNELRYPGDPSAPAREVINCHCTLIPHVLLKGEKMGKLDLKQSGNDGIIKLDLQMFAARREKAVYTQSSAEIKKSIRTFRKLIEQHKKKIANPSEYDSEWSNKDKRAQDGLVDHWVREISNFEASIETRIEELKRRGEDIE